ncbi:MAG: diadenylate cyclase CdaA [Kiritimatiellae bacterium]|nr:diadenylate cyclase CdaA [Kiritimatiellia bacterium]
MAVPLFYLFKFLRRTRGYRVLAGLFLVLAGMHFASAWLHLEELAWILGHFATWLPLFLVILFQPELRRIFAEIGGRGSRPAPTGEAAVNIVSQIAKCVESLAQQRIGALIALEREENLDAFAVGGRALDAPLNAELLATVFWPGSPLHDGGVVIRGGTIAWAGCVFPLGAMDDRRRAFGTRHRAAIGLAERTDALVVVVSEETGLVSVAYRGELLRGLGMNSLVKVLGACIGPSPGRSDPSATISEALRGGGPDSDAGAGDGQGEEAGPRPDRVAAAIAAVKEEA